jgi:ribonuclease Z
MSIEAFILGTGGSMPLPHRALTSMLLRREGQLFLFDCGEGTQVNIRRLNLRWKQINAIFISHTHADHITGLPGILMLSSQVERSEPLYIIGPARIREYVESSRKILEMFINYEIIIQEIEDPNTPQIVFSHNDYLVRSFPLRHTRACVGYSFIENHRPGIFHPERAIAAGVPRGPLWSKLQSGQPVTALDGRNIAASAVMGPARRGRKISYVTDTLPHGSISKEVAGSDFFLCEGMFEEALADTAHAKKHMTAREAAHLAAAADGVRELGLFHFSPRYTDKELKLLLDEAQAVFPKTQLLRDRQNIQIPLSDEELT